MGGWTFAFTKDERTALKAALGRLASHANADAFIDDVASFVQVASEEGSGIYGPFKKRVSAVNNAAQQLRIAIEALTPDDMEELQSFSVAAIEESIHDLRHPLEVLTAAAGLADKSITPNQHARDGQQQARMLITLSGQAWLNRFEKMPSVSKADGRASPFVRVMQSALKLLGWPASFDFISNAAALANRSSSSQPEPNIESQEVQRSGAVITGAWR